jgi:NAD(P)-dependent dehydrogenase (short-subunit alcohol dehydrogenase family)
MPTTPHRWTEADVPDQRGRTAVITGGNNGLGFQTALVLARRGATVVLACRDAGRAAAAADRIAAAVPAARVDTVPLDLARQSSVRAAADRLRAAYPCLDLLINNAGLVVPARTVTEDGFELTLATNHLGHFALTGLLLDALLATPGSRVVTVSSIGHRRGVLDTDDVHSARRYRPSTAYFQSKLANLLFTYELQRRLAAAGAGTVAVAAHPGNARTSFGHNWSPVVRVGTSPRLRPLTWWLMQSPQVGALATVRAAVDPAARGGEYYGPPGRAQFTGHPEVVRSSERSYDPGSQRWLWAESERLTGVGYPALTARPANRPGGAPGQPTARAGG